MSQKMVWRPLTAIGGHQFFNPIIRQFQNYINEKRQIGLMQKVHYRTGEIYIYFSVLTHLKIWDKVFLSQLNAIEPIQVQKVSARYGHRGQVFVTFRVRY